MSHRHATLALAALLAAAAVAITTASTPTFWQVATRADFLKGDVENLSIDKDGRLSLGPPTTLLYDSAAPFLWTVVTGTDGALLVGSGNEGKVFRIGADGKTSVFFDASEMEVHALAPAPGGGLYVATSPDGQIYKVDSKGAGRPFFKPEAKYIWSLAVDAAGNVFAGTGEGGAIYKISPDGKGQVFYKTKATSVVALALDPSGNLLAGTESPGRVFRIDRDGRAFVLLESSYREVHSLHVDAKGVIYATAVAAKSGGAGTEERTTESPSTEPARTTPVASVSTEITGFTVIDTSGSAADAKAGAAKAATRGAKGAIYRILPDGLWDTIWESADDTPYDVAPSADGSLLVATGNKGKIFRLTGDPVQVTLVGRAPAQQITSLLTTPKGDVYYVTSNPGKVFRLSAGHAERGTYESDVRDTQTVSTWGTISWRGSTPAGAQIEIRTRSGNSQTPDDTWSQWSEPYRNPGGQPIQSPKARYLQWQATLTGKDASPVLTSVTAAYLQRNLRPRVTSITVYPAGHVFQKPYSTGESGDRRVRRQLARHQAVAGHARGGHLHQLFAGAEPARQAHLPEGAADIRLEGRGRQRRHPPVRPVLSARGRDGLEGAQARHDRPALRLGHDRGSRRHLPRARRRQRQPVERPVARAVGGRRKRGVRHRQHAADDPRARCPP